MDSSYYVKKSKNNRWKHEENIWNSAIIKSKLTECIIQQCQFLSVSQNATSYIIKLIYNLSDAKITQIYWYLVVTSLIRMLLIFYDDALYFKFEVIK
jgi:hypothetical protein